MKLIFVINLILQLNFLISAANQLPENLTTCSRSDLNFNKCLASAIQNALKVLKDGNKDFDLPKIEPLRIHYTEAITPGGNQNFHLKSSLKDIDISGLSTAKILRSATKFDKSFGVKLEGQIDKFSIVGNYMMSGKVLVLPINGEGKCNVTLQDVRFLCDGRGRYFKKDDNKTYIDFHTLSIKLLPKKVNYFFENLFKNDENLSNTINKFMNDEWELVSNNLLPGYEKEFGKMFAEIANKIFSNVPTDEIFHN